MDGTKKWTRNPCVQYAAPQVERHAARLLVIVQEGLMITTLRYYYNCIGVFSLSCRAEWSRKHVSKTVAACFCISHISFHLFICVGHTGPQTCKQTDIQTDRQTAQTMHGCHRKFCRGKDFPCLISVYHFSTFT